MRLVGWLKRVKSRSEGGRRGSEDRLGRTHARCRHATAHSQRENGPTSLVEDVFTLQVDYIGEMVVASIIL